MEKAARSILNDDLIISRLSSRAEDKASLNAVFFVVLAVLLILVAIFLFLKRREAADDKDARRRLIASLCLFAAGGTVIGTGILTGVFSENGAAVADDWYVKTVTVEHKEKRDIEHRTRYTVSFSGGCADWHEADGYNTVEKGDTVYAVISASRPKEVLTFYNTRDYVYEGKRLRE